MKQIKVLWKKLHPDAKGPHQATDGSAGFDLCVLDDVLLQPWGLLVVGTGLALAIPEGFEGQVRPRSGVVARTGVTIGNAPGTIDSDYRGEVKLILQNNSTGQRRFNAGEGLAQLVVKRVPVIEFIEVDDLDATVRGDGGLGSTGR